MKNDKIRKSKSHVIKFDGFLSIDNQSKSNLSKKIVLLVALILIIIQKFLNYQIIQ